MSDIADQGITCKKLITIMIYFSFSFQLVLHIYHYDLSVIYIRWYFPKKMAMCVPAYIDSEDSLTIGLYLSAYTKKNMVAGWNCHTLLFCSMFSPKIAVTVVLCILLLPQGVPRSFPSDASMDVN